MISSVVPIRSTMKYWLKSPYSRQWLFSVAAALRTPSVGQRHVGAGLFDLAEGVGLLRGPEKVPADRIGQEAPEGARVGRVARGGGPASRDGLLLGGAGGEEPFGPAGGVGIWPERSSASMARMGASRSGRPSAAESIEWA